MPISNPPISIPGPQGFPGVDGEDGIDGISIIGPTGLAGASGSQGIQGLPGIPGTDGEDGLDGFPGSQGIQGVQGINGTNGTNGVNGIPGLDGEDGLDGITIVGPIGPQGPQGLIGPPGYDGEDIDNWPVFNTIIDDPIEQIPRVLDQNAAILPNYSSMVIGPYTINIGKKLAIGSKGRFKIDSGNSLRLVQTSITLTNAQILTLPSAEITLLVGQGVALAIFPLFLIHNIDTTAGAYTNVAATATSRLRLGTVTLGGTTSLTGVIDSAQTSYFANSITLAAGATSSQYNIPLKFSATNPAMGNFTGGNAANTWKITLLALIVI